MCNQFAKEFPCFRICCTKDGGWGGHLPQWRNPNDICLSKYGIGVSKFSLDFSTAIGHLSESALVMSFLVRVFGKANAQVHAQGLDQITAGDVSHAWVALVRFPPSLAVGVVLLEKLTRHN